MRLNIYPLQGRPNLFIGLWQKEEQKKVTPLTLSSIDELSGEEFEQFLKLLFTRLGYKATLIGSSGDQGGDLIIEKKMTR